MNGNNTKVIWYFAVYEEDFFSKIPGRNRMKEYDFYGEVKNWDFSTIKMTKECLTDWDMRRIISQNATRKSRILDLGTGGGEKVLKDFPDVAEILGTDYSETMIQTANENLKKSGKKNIVFRVMDNLEMDTPEEYFDIVTARHTCTNPVQIYKTLKPGGVLIVRGVDQLDCWELKRLFKRGQAFHDKKSISRIDYEAILDAGFRKVELVPIHTREYFDTPDDLLALLHKAPILDDFSETMLNDNQKYIIDSELFEQYVAEHRTKKFSVKNSSLSHS